MKSEGVDAVRKPTVFLSHNQKDKEFVRRLANDLKLAGAKVWIDEAEIKVGDSLIEKIRSGIDDVDYLAVILSSHSVRSEWVKKEVDVAINQEIEQKRVKVLPVLLESCDLPGFLKGKLYADFTTRDRYSTGLTQILNRLELTRPAPSRFFSPTLLRESLARMARMNIVIGGDGDEAAFEMLFEREPYEVGEWLLEKLTPLPQSYSWMENRDTINIIVRVIDEMNELSFETGDWLLERLTPADPDFWKGRSEDGSLLKELMGWIISQMGRLSARAESVRDSFVREANDSPSFSYDWEFNDWVVYREYAIYSALKAIGDPVSLEAISTCWPDGKFRNSGMRLGDRSLNTTCLLDVLHRKASESVR